MPQGRSAPLRWGCIEGRTTSHAHAQEDTYLDSRRKLRKDIIDLTGQQIGDWAVLGRADKQYPSQTATAFVCRCKCGGVYSVLSHHLRSGRSRGCMKCHRKYALGQVFGTRSIVAEPDGRHPDWKWKCSCGATGYTSTPVALQSRRCIKCIPNGEWCIYGKKYTANGKTGGMSYWAKKTGLTRQGIYHRLDMGWPEHLAVSLPKGSPRPEGINGAADRRNPEGAGHPAEGDGAVHARARVSG